MPNKKVEKILVDELPIEVKENCIYEINQPNPNSYTHNYFKYPCKFIPEIPRWAIKTYLGEGLSNKIVLDPFAGSGTTLLEASLLGIQSIGTEIDDIAKLIIRVKTTQLSDQEIKSIAKFTEQLVAELENKSYPVEETIFPDINNLNHWFNDDVLNDLGHIYFMIQKESDVAIKNFLLLCMASIIKRVSNADDISPKPYVSNKIKKNPPQVAKVFQDTVNKNLDGMVSMKEKELSTVKVDGNALQINRDDESVDLAITSPPYINAFDYVRTLRLENLWLQLSTEELLREKKKKYLGTESINVKIEKENIDILNKSDLLKDYYCEIEKVDIKRSLIVKKFFEDMLKNMKEVNRVLKDDAYYVIVIGNSYIRSVDIESWRVLKDLSLEAGFEYSTHIGYEIKNPYIRIPRGGKGGKIAVDHILVLKKSRRK